ncbi:MAG TPA: TetR/AcrR family transcriptional regulator [Streptosporangiaceae bacterium]|nr:TetR/AcrR family transcriptional regulator [Streptosporangiaceae bacterium]
MAQAKGFPEQSQAMGLRERKKEQTRAAIAHTAITLFLERGFEQVSIAEIAEAAGVAKQTVTNYFPNKEDLVITAQDGLIPDLAGAVRDRGPGESPVAALHRFVRSELDRRAEWTQLHDGVAPFARMGLASPTLTEAFVRLWGEIEADLARAFEEVAAGDAGTGGDLGSVAGQAMALLQAGKAADEELGRLAASITVARIRAGVAAGQVAAAVRTLTTANLIRQVAGLTTEQTAAQSYTETAAAFALLESGLSGFSG